MIKTIRGSYSVFVPVRTGSQRIKKKNTRPFAGIPGGLVELKLRQLCALSDNFEIVLSTDDEKTINIAKKPEFIRRVKVFRRPDDLCRSNTPLRELIDYVPTVCRQPWIVWSHATSPFMNSDCIISAVLEHEKGLKKGHDSLIGIMELQKYLLDPVSMQPINYDRNKDPWPPTQSLPLIYEVNSSIFIASREHYKKNHDRIGLNPLPWRTPLLAAFDIDYENDFVLAEAIQRKIDGKKVMKKRKI